jgi:uncharacterized protein (DUF302 family)
MRRRMMGVCVLLLLTLSVNAAEAAEQMKSDIVMRSIKGKYDDVKERVSFAIENRGIVLNYTARVGNMLERTGKDLGRRQPVYAQAEVLEFCSAALSRDTMEADPHNIAYCPYAIAVYTLAQEPGRVYVSYRKPPPAGSQRSIQALRAVEKLLEDIVQEALR